MSQTIHKHRSRGYTLGELIIVMLIVGIIAAIGLPSFKYVTTSNRVASEVNGLLGDMQFARSQAVKEGQTVTVCASVSPYTNCSASPNWNTGWIVFLDVNSNMTVSAGEAILRTQPTFGNTDTFAADNSFTGAVYNREGYAATGTTNTVTVALHDSTSNAEWTRCLAITPVGMMTTQKVGVGNCS